MCLFRFCLVRCILSMFNGVGCTSTEKLGYCQWSGQLMERLPQDKASLRCSSGSSALAASKLLSHNRDNIATRTFRTIASHNVYNISVVEQCIFLDSTLGTKSTAYILNNTDMVEAVVKHSSNQLNQPTCPPPSRT